MTELDCNVLNCVYNKEKKCCKDGISVGGKDAYECQETCCESFVCSCGSNAADAHKTINSKMDIACEAINCIHNNNCKCQAERIDISGRNAETVQQTECAAFSCK